MLGEVILENFCKALEDLVECYANVKPHITAEVASANDHQFTAIIGMCDDGLSASVALTTNVNTVQALSRIPLVNEVDWLGELSNQLAGRFKNKLSVYGLRPKLSTPTTVSGQRLLLGAAAGDVYVFSVEWPGCRLEAQLSVEVEDCLVLSVDNALDSAEEGSLSLF